MTEAQQPPATDLIKSAFGLIHQGLSWLTDRAFSYSSTAATVRGLVSFLIFAGLFMWLVMKQLAGEATFSTLQGFMDAWLSLDAPFDARLSATYALLITVIHPANSLPVLRDFLVVYVPFALAMEFAAIYQHDVFEKEIGVTRNFINQTAFAAHYHVIHVREGRVIPADEDSPIIQIGGPGLVEVELDSAIVVEDADNNVRVIGPTGKKPWGKETLNGFERIRQGFDLRERSLKIDSIKARSRDGIEVEARDIHYNFSVYRGETQPSKNNPYPYHEESLINFVYNGPPPKEPGWKKPIADNMMGPIMLEFIMFVSKRNVGEFLASVGQPEMEALERRKASLQQLGVEAAVNGVDPSIQPTTFTSRPMVSEIFNSEAFRKNVIGKGFSLRWLGVGTWHFPDKVKVIPESHFEAWEISRDNGMRGSEIMLNKLRENAKYDELHLLLTRVLLEPYYDHAEDHTADALVDRWIVNYYERLRLARQIYERVEKPVPDSIVKALEVFDEIRSVHWVDDDEEGVPLG